MAKKFNLKLNSWAVLACIVVQFVLSGVILFGFKVQDMTIGRGTIKEVDVPMVVEMGDGTEIEVADLPYYPESAAGDVIRLKMQLTSKYKGKNIIFLTADKWFTVYLDDKVIYEFGTWDYRLFGHTPGSNMNFVQLPRDWDNGELVIEMESYYDNFASYLTEMYYADRDVAILETFRSNIGKLGCSVVLLFCGILLIILSVVQIFTKLPSDGLPMLGGLLIAAAIYYGVETKVLSIMYGNQTLYSYFVFATIMMFPVLLLNYYIAANEVKFTRLFKIMLPVSYLNVAVQIVFQLLDIVDFLELATLAHVVMYLSVMLVEAEYIYQLISTKDRSLILEITAMASILIGGGADLAMTRVIRVGDLGRYSRIGTMFFGLLMVFVHIRRIAANSKRRAEESLEIIKKHNEELQISEQRAEAANKAKSDFLSQMSHEIRTPINAVLGMNEMIIRESNDEKILEYASTVRDSGNALLSIVSDVLDITKIESGKLEIENRPYDLYAVIHDCYNMIKDRMSKKEFDLFFTVDEMLPSVLNGDAAKIRQLIMNLLTNAVKYTEEGSVELVIIGEDAGDDIILHIIVKDTGIGIDEANLNKLFTKFQRVDIEHNQTVEGTGLGLAITKYITDAMGGTVGVSSEYGKGSTFRIQVPQGVVERKPIGEVDFERKNTGIEDIKHIEKEIFTAPNARILVVDDVETNLMVFASLLKKTKMQIDKARSGFECLDLVHKNKYDIIFMDHMMPEMDGVETYKNMCAEGDEALNATTPVVMLTANAISGVKEEYLDEGFADYLSKPIKVDQLEEVILNFLPADKVDNK